jgi:hypothetical protein
MQTTILKNDLYHRMGSTEDQFIGLSGSGMKTLGSSSLIKFISEVMHLAQIWNILVSNHLWKLLFLFSLSSVFFAQTVYWRVFIKEATILIAVDCQMINFFVRSEVFMAVTRKP